MDAVEAIQTAVAAAFAADTGAGGLQNTTGNQYVIGGLHRRGTPRRTIAEPWLEYEIAARQTDAQIRHTDAIVTFFVRGKKDLFPTAQNAISERLIALFHNTIPSGYAATGWEFGYPVLVAPERQSPDNFNITGAGVPFRIHVHKAIT